MSEPIETKLKPLPVGVPYWSDIRDQNYFFVDKTALLGQLVTARRFVFISRPRRMGKTLLCSQLADLFAHGDVNFAGTAIYGKWPESKCYPVINLSFINIQGSDFELALRGALVDAFDFAGFPEALNISFEIQFNHFLGRLESLIKNCRVVFLIDEWDYPLSSHLDDEQAFNSVRATLAIFYSWLRTLPNVRFALITGIMRYSEASLFTGQDIQDISMDPDFANLVGYTQEELETNYAPYIEAAAQILKISQEELLSRLKQYYDGFCFDYDAEVNIYCPYSINRFFDPVARKLLGDKSKKLPEFDSYWMDSSNATAALRSYLHRDNPSVDKVIKLCRQNLIINKSTITTPTDFNAITELHILFQSGFITLKSVTDNTKGLSPGARQYNCGFTNYDVVGRYAAVLASYLTNNINESDIEPCFYQAQQALLADDIELTCISINELLCKIRFDVMANAQENFYRTFIALALRSDMITVAEEYANNLGRCDLVITTAHCLYAIELKRLYGDSDKKEDKLQLLDAAEQQILDKCYLNNIPAEGRRVISVQIVISDLFRQLSAWRASDKIKGVRQGFIEPVTAATKS